MLIEPHEPERKAGKIVIPQNVSERTVMLEDRARVLDVGPSAWHDEPQPRAKAGDLVLVAKFSGYMARGADGKTYRIVNDRDIFAGLDEAAWKEAAVKKLEVANV